MLDSILKLLVALIAVLMLVMGLQWVVMPASIAESLGMQLLDGFGRSTQVGDMMAFFICVGVFALLGLVTRQRPWFHASSLLLGCAAVGRLFAWILHDATLAIPEVPAELLMTAILLSAAHRLGRTG